MKNGSHLFTATNVDDAKYTIMEYLPGNSNSVFPLPPDMGLGWRRRVLFGKKTHDI